jgi:hypothetical protein
MTKSGDTREDLIGRLGPHEGLRSLVIHGQVAVDGLSRLETSSNCLFAPLALGEGSGRAPASGAATGIATHDFRRSRGLLDTPGRTRGRQRSGLPPDPRGRGWFTAGPVTNGKGAPVRHAAAVPPLTQRYRRAGQRVPKRILRETVEYVSWVDILETWRPTAGLTRWTRRSSGRNVCGRAAARLKRPAARTGPGSAIQSGHVDGVSDRVTARRTTTRAEVVKSDETVGIGNL